MGLKIVVGIPTEGHSPAEAMHNRLLMAYHQGRLQRENEYRNGAPKFQFFLHTAGRLFTPMAREKLADDALRLGADYIFMIDDDMLAPPDIFERLWAHQVDMVAALAFTRNPPHLAVLYTLRQGWDPTAHREFVQYEWVRNWPRGKLVECDAVGFGAVLIKCDVLRKMKRPFFMSSTGTGEDILFCHKARKEAGARVFMDTSLEIGHIGSPVIIDQEASERYNKPEEMERLFGPYKKHGVFDVAHLPAEAEPGTLSQEPEVLAGAV